MCIPVSSSLGPGLLRFPRQRTPTTASPRYPATPHTTPASSPATSRDVSDSPRTQSLASNQPQSALGKERPAADQHQPRLNPDQPRSHYEQSAFDGQQQEQRELIGPLSPSPSDQALSPAFLSSSLRQKQGLASSQPTVPLTTSNIQHAGTEVCKCCHKQCCSNVAACRVRSWLPRLRAVGGRAACSASSDAGVRGQETGRHLGNRSEASPPPSSPTAPLFGRLHGHTANVSVQQEGGDDGGQLSGQQREMGSTENGNGQSTQGAHTPPRLSTDFFSAAGRQQNGRGSAVDTDADKYAG
ncbi:hypothetical protein B0J12DRAFT_152302 [Macrophomina phaseolina]|uniref:Uncharacterized protein n=1 Tax=Macrophomina phaseolina TaxID=35725 RepID=A0ABQ8G557_9PEZI|nr:hypothetical protein B0J12DRAFT_152302 [Macrophomina phaseolina]